MKPRAYERGTDPLTLKLWKNRHRSKSERGGRGSQTAEKDVSDEFPVTFSNQRNSCVTGFPQCSYKIRLDIAAKCTAMNLINGLVIRLRLVSDLHSATLRFCF